MGSSAWTRRRGQGSIDSGNCVRVALEKLCPNLCLPANSINYDRERHDSPEALAGYGFGGSLSSSVVSGRIPSKLLILHPPASLQAGGRRFESCTAHQLSDCFQT